MSPHRLSLPARRVRPRRAAWIAAALVLVAFPAAAARVGAPRPLTAPRLNAATDGAGFPEPFWLSLLTAVGAGAAGAMAAGRLAGGRRAAAGGWAARALPAVTVGSTAAVVALTVNPPGAAWWSLAATAAAAGLGAEALVLAARREPLDGAQTEAGGAPADPAGGR